LRKNRQAELIKQLTQSQLIFHLYFTQILVISIAIILSFFIFPDFAAYFSLFHWDIKWIGIGVVNGIIIVIIDLILMNKLPKRYYDDGGINEKIFTGLPVWKIAWLALVIGIAEELLFRGVIQTKFGLIIASVIFALIHIRYWTHWFLLANVIVLSFWIGLIYQWSGGQIIPVIAMHFTIDFLLGIYVSKNGLSKIDEERIL